MNKKLALLLTAGLLILSIQNLYSTIIYTPFQPNVERQVTFNVTHPLGISTPTVQWDFGDGTSITGLTTATKIYYQAGLYTVRVRYKTVGIIGAPQQKVSEQTTIKIVEKRKISFHPSSPYVHQPVTFRAENFLSSQILWDFGDGTTPEIKPRVITHSYTRGGQYIVRAIDLNGESRHTFSATVTVTEIRGPRAPFQISFIQLRFEDGKPYKVVSKNFEPLVVYADIKYEGTGILQGQWLVDGEPFSLISYALPFAKQTVINSGKIPGFPTQSLGRHEVSLRIIQPKTEYTIPVIRYFVSLERLAEKKKVELHALEAFDLEGEVNLLSYDSIQAPSKDYFILNGLIKNEEEMPISFTLLRIYLEKKLIVQQIIKDLKPLEERKFMASIYNSSPDPKKMSIVLYNVSEPPANLLYVKDFKIVSR